MRRFHQARKRSYIADIVQNTIRRWRWFVTGTTREQLVNLVVSAAKFALHRPTSARVPVMIKLDISPMCNLHCTFCVHSDADDDALSEQRFSSAHRVDLDQFERLVEQVHRRTSVIALYYVGDPLVHPDLARMCRIAADARIRTHVSTNFSFVLSDARLRELVESGLTHLTVCIDSMVQAEYEKTRVGGDVALVMANLRRLLQLRAELGIRGLHVEVQYIQFQHNLEHIAAAERWCHEQGVDQFTTFWGNLHNYVDLDPQHITVMEPHLPRWIPRCAWPYFAVTVRYDGATLPCCYHRVSEQYRTGGDDRAVANVFDQSIESVWRGPAYAELRRTVWNPAGRTTESREAAFCHGCDAIEHTTTDTLRRRADQHEWVPVTLSPTPTRSGTRPREVAPPIAVSMTVTAEMV
jgi:MoaA/NifB/PqqE/SkfB family radical SAM enzyme